MATILVYPGGCNYDSELDLLYTILINSGGTMADVESIYNSQKKDLLYAILKVSSQSNATGITLRVVDTYSEMINQGRPDTDTIYSVTTDENKSYERSLYLWKSNGQREWLASVLDNQFIA